MSSPFVSFELCKVRRQTGTFVYGLIEQRLEIVRRRSLIRLRSPYIHSYLYPFCLISGSLDSTSQYQ